MKKNFLMINKPQPPSKNYRRKKICLDDGLKLSEVLKYFTGDDLSKVYFDTEDDINDYEPWNRPYFMLDIPAEECPEYNQELKEYEKNLKKYETWYKNNLKDIEEWEEQKRTEEEKYLKAQAKKIQEQLDALKK